MRHECKRALVYRISKTRLSIIFKLSLPTLQYSLLSNIFSTFNVYIYTTIMQYTITLYLIRHCRSVKRYTKCKHKSDKFGQKWVYPNFFNCHEKNSIPIRNQTDGNPRKSRQIEIKILSPSIGMYRTLHTGFYSMSSRIL